LFVIYLATNTYRVCSWLLLSGIAIRKLNRHEI
jgi:hypothetical protein